MQRIQVLDSHTGGEPTRIIVRNGPELGNGSLVERLQRFETEFDHIRSATVNEPRGSDVLVGGLLTEPSDSSCVAGIIFFNNTGYLGMCGHGTIGLMATLHYLNKVDYGRHKIETPVGIVTAELMEDGSVAVENVPSYRFQSDVSVSVPDFGKVVGDVAWGGNWFFLVKDPVANFDLSTDQLTRYTMAIRRQLVTEEITGVDGAEIDHIELFGTPNDPANHSRNFVLCPGGAFDRSPCGTGSSAKLACLAANNQLPPGDVWRQESVIGSVFECTYRLSNSSATSFADGPTVVPTITGRAHICGEATLILDPNDPFCTGIPT